MPAAFVQQKQGSGASSTSLISSGTFTTTAGNALAMFVTYTGAAVGMTVYTNHGTWTEDASLARTGTGICTHVFTIDSCIGAAAAPTINLATARTFRGLFICEISGVDHYVGGVAPAYQVTPGLGGDAITTGPFNVTSPPNYLLSICYDQTNGGTIPNVGASSAGQFTGEGTGWLMADGTANARVMDARAVVGGNNTATWQSTVGNTNTFMSTLLAFAEQISSQVLMSQCMY